MDIGRIKAAIGRIAWHRQDEKPRAQAFDPLDVWAEPQRYNRRSRRAAGYLKPVWLDLRKVQVALYGPLAPRFVRRHKAALDSTETATRRVRRAKARCTRALQVRGLTLA